MVPGTAHAVPPSGPDDEDEEGEEGEEMLLDEPLPLTTEMRLRLNPLASKARVMICVPALSVTGTSTVVQVCQLPVDGIDTALHTPLLSKPTCIAPPPLGDATRNCSM